MASETPLSLNIPADALWEFLSCRHAVISWGEPAQSAEAVVVHEAADRTIFFLPGAVAEGIPLVSLFAQGEDGSDLPNLVSGGYAALDANGFNCAKTRDSTTLFSDVGLSPSRWP